MAIPLTPAVKRTTLTGVRCDEPGIIRPAGEGLAGQAGGLFFLFVLPSKVISFFLYQSMRQYVGKYCVETF